MKVKFSFRLKNGETIPQDEVKDFDISQVIALFKSDQVSYPVMINGIIRPSRAEIGESVFDMNNDEPMVNIVLKEI